MANSDQSALAANFVNVQNALAAASSAAAAGVNLIDNHFAPGAVPRARAAFMAAQAAADAQQSAVTAIASDQAEAVALA